MRTIVRTIVILVLLAPPAAAHDPASRFPASALLYAELPDLRALPQKLVDLPIWKDPRAIAQSKKQLLGLLEKQLARELKLDWKTVIRIAGQASKLTFCLTDVHLRSEMPVFTIVLDLSTTADAKALVTGPLKKMFKQTLQIDGKTVYVAQIEREVNLLLHLSQTQAVFTIDRRSMKTYLASGSVSNSLASLKPFQQLRKRHGKQQLWAFGNIGRAFDLLTDTLSRRKRMVFDKIDAVFYFRGMQYIGAGSQLEKATDGKATEATLIIDPEHRIYKLAQTPKLDQALLQWVPGDYTYFTLGIHTGNPVSLWKEIVKLGKQTDKALDTNAFSRELDRFKARAGLSVAEVLAHFEPDGLMTGQSNGSRQRVTFLLRIKDRPAFDKLATKLKQSRLFDGDREHKSEVYRGVRIQTLGRSYRAPSYAVLDKTLILAQELDIVKLFIKAYKDQKSLVQRYKLETGLEAYHKLLFLDPLFLTDQESDFYFARYLIRPGIPLLVGTIEQQGQLRVSANLSAFSVAAALGLASWHWQSTRHVASNCQRNLRQIGRALSKVVKASGAYPASLAALELNAELLGCPIDRKKGIAQTYKYFPLKLPKNGRYYGLVAWCPHTKHGRVLLAASGTSHYSERTRETEFRNRKAALDWDLAQARKEREKEQQEQDK